MTEPSQYFKGRTVQEQMNEVIGYVDARAEEVAAAKADDVLQPAEDAKDAAIAAKEAAESARDTTLAALPQIQSDLNAVTLRVTTAEGQIVTIQGRVTALETADGQNVKLTGEHAIGNYAVLLTGNQNNIGGSKEFIGYNTISRGNPVFACKSTNLENLITPATSIDVGMQMVDKNGADMGGFTAYHGTNGDSQIILGLTNPSTGDKCKLHIIMKADTSIQMYMDATGGRSVNIASIPARS